MYPAVKQHLLSFGYDRLKQTGESGARKKTNNKWFETQDSISYWDDFYRRKIAWKAVGRNLAFSIVEEGTFITAPACFFTSDKVNLQYLLAVLCSSYTKYFIYNNSDTTGAGDIMLNIQSLEKLPIPKINKEIELQIDKLLETQSYKEIDKLIYGIYNLTEEEINFISSFVS
jgi:hypothetical protein